MIGPRPGAFPRPATQAVTARLPWRVRWLGLLEQLPGVFQVDFRLVYAVAASDVSALKQA
jgi:hypothetical protein